MIGGIMIGFIKRIGVYLFLLLLILLSSCTFNGVNQATPPVEFEEANLNNQFTLFVDDAVNSYRISEPIFINLHFQIIIILEYLY